MSLSPTTEKQWDFGPCGIVINLSPRYWNPRKIRPPPRGFPGEKGGVLLKRLGGSLKPMLVMSDVLRYLFAKPFPFASLGCKLAGSEICYLSSHRNTYICSLNFIDVV